MKQFLTFFVICILASNAYLVSACGEPCADENEAKVIAHVSDADDMPCHEQPSEPDSLSHCDGNCLCLHIAGNNTSMVSDYAVVNQLPYHSERSTLVINFYPSALIAPPSPPPKPLS